MIVSVVFIVFKMLYKWEATSKTIRSNKLYLNLQQYRTQAYNYTCRYRNGIAVAGLSTFI